MGTKGLDLTHFPDELRADCLRVCDLVLKSGGRALLVGGCVRDLIIGLEPKDVDIEVFGIAPERLQRLLGNVFALDLVGKSFGVLKLKGRSIDISIPRREGKQGQGHQGFWIESDPAMTFEEAASRRDFTLNAISWDPLSGELIDPFHGQSDLIHRILRHCSNRFAEDPLRVLRGMQFVARFKLQLAPETIKIAQSIRPEGLSIERLFEEWKKMLLKGFDISGGLNYLKATGWLQYYPELEALVGCKQDPEWHPEGDVWTHTRYCLDAFAKERIGDDWEDLIVGFAVLCHDMGKPSTSVVDADGRIRSPRHDIEGVDVAASFLKRLTLQSDLIEAVLPLVRCHMQALDLYRNKASDAAIRRLAHRVGRIDRLVRVDSADRQGRGDVFVDASPQGTWLIERAHALAIKDKRPVPIIMGRHLIEQGLQPGPQFKDILKLCYETQLDGGFADLAGGKQYLRQLLEANSSSDS